MPDVRPQFPVRTLLKCVRIVEILPAGSTFQNHDAIFITGVVISLPMRVMRHTHKIKAIFFKALHFFIDCIIRRRISKHIRFFMEICAAYIHLFIIDINAVSLPLHFPDSVRSLLYIFYDASCPDRGTYRIQIRCVRRPQSWIRYRHGLFKGFRASGSKLHPVLFLCRYRSIRIQKLRQKRHFFFSTRFIFHMRLYLQRRFLPADAGRSNEYAAARRDVSFYRIRDMQSVRHCQIRISIDSPKILKIRHVLSWCKGLVRTAVCLDCNHILLSIPNLLANINHKRNVASLMGPYKSPIDIHIRFLHNSFKSQKQLFPSQVFVY